MTDEPIVQFRKINKRFPGVQALRDIDLEIAPGSCHGLVGENGAGKSTLGKVLAGLYAPDSGELRVRGQAVSFANARAAMLAGIGMVHQELLFCENLSVAENLCLWQLPARGPFLRRRAMHQEARELLARIGAAIEPNRIVGTLPISQQQLIQIAAAVGRGARILVFDEPTSSLSCRESERLFELIRQLKSQGVNIVYVSHRMNEIFQLCDQVTVMRDGQVVTTRPIGAFTEDSMVEQMIGRALGTFMPEHLRKPTGPELLRVESLTSPGKFDDISFTLHAGEALGLAGLVGAGRTEVAEAIFGLDPRARGRVFIRGNPVSFGNVRQAMNYRLGLVPEDRKRHGLVLSMNGAQNLSLPILERMTRCGWICRGREHRLATDYFKQLNVRAPSIHAGVAGLSGGNQQKIIIARWLAAECDILLVDEPTRGVDVGAKAEIHGLLDRLVSGGAGLLLISSDLPEVLALSTRILVLREGRIAGELNREQANQNNLARLMTGIGGTVREPDRAGPTMADCTQA